VAATAAGAVTAAPGSRGGLAGQLPRPTRERLRAGWLVLPGGLTAPVPLKPGQAVTAELDGLGPVEVYSR
jgi:2-keto-4-pentenoate hydratase